MGVRYMQVGKATTADAGKPCVICKKPICVGDEVVEFPSMQGSLFHYSCFVQLEGADYRYPTNVIGRPSV